MLLEALFFRSKNSDLQQGNPICVLQLQTSLFWYF